VEVGGGGVAVSPDGTSVYVAGGGGVAIFDRDPTTGALTQKSGTAGCVSETGTGGACQDGVEVGGGGVAVSPDGTSVYVAGSGLAIFDRDPRTGALTQKPGTAGCVSETGTGGACQDGVAIGGGGVAVSPDGASVYVIGRDAVAIFDRDPRTGAFAQKSGTAGCVSETGDGGACQDGVGLVIPTGVAVSPDGASVYVTSHFASVAIFDRELAPSPPTSKERCKHGDWRSFPGFKSQGQCVAFVQRGPK
jgi:DNA-binding beta-propeller fold protein YncE